MKSLGIQKKILYGYLIATSCILIGGWLILGALSTTPFLWLTAAFWGTALPLLLILSLLLQSLSRRLLDPLLRFKEICKRIAAGEEVHDIEIKRDEASSHILRGILSLVEEEKRVKQEVKATLQEPSLQKFYPQLLEAEKLKLLSDGLRGVIHELNNPLTSVLGFTELLLEEVASQKAAGTVEKIYSEAKRCRKIIEDLQAYVRRPAGGFKEMVPINDLVERACFMRSYLWRTHHIQVEKDMAYDLPLCVADPVQFQQALLCLLANAEDSIAASAESQKKTFEGSIKIKTEVDEQRLRVRIEDNGCGISPENLVKIFNPFFSTKPGKLGLGLNLASFLVKQQGGTIQALSREGAGSVFIVEIPAAAQPSLPEEKESEKPIRKAS